DHIARTAKAVLPEVVADRHDLGSLWTIFVAREESAEHRTQAEHDRKVIAHLRAVDTLGSAAFAGEVHTLVGPNAYRIERSRAVTPHREVGIVDAGELEIPSRRFLIDVHEAIGIREGKRAQKETVEQCEDRGVRRNGERERREQHRGGAG